MIGRPPLPRRQLGRTGIDIPILALGTAPSGHGPESDAVRLYHACLDAGVTHFDTGPQRGGYGHAQTFLGEVLRTRRAEAFVATRCSEPDGERALVQLRENLAALQIERADLVYVQSLGDNAMTPDRIYGASGVCRALERARADGLTRWLGVSGHHRPQRFLTALQEWDFDVMMNAVSVVSRHLYNFEETVWPAAAARGVGLIGMKVFGGVREGVGSPRGANLPDALKPSALRYALALPTITAVAVGMWNTAELDAALGWLDDPQPLTAEEMISLEGPTKALSEEWQYLYGPLA